jgi:hypothetical protein
VKLPALALLASLSLGALGCDRGTALDGTCRADAHCPMGWECVRASGVCERSTTPLDGFEAMDLAVVVDAPIEDAQASDSGSDGSDGASGG